MLIVMDSAATADDVRRVIEAVEGLGLQAHAIPGAQRTAIGVTGNRGSVESASFENLPGVAEVIPVTAPYKLVSREAKREDTVVSIGGVAVGGHRVAVVAGPCAVESEKQALDIARQVCAGGATLYRGGAFKPRTSPYSFQGLGEAGLKILAKVREETGLPIVTEVLDTDTAELVAEYADCLQIGARNMQNFALLKKIGRMRKPVLLKRGMSATIEEFLLSAEYLLSEGNYEVVLCERGVRTFANHTRNTLDLSVVPYVKRISHLPILVDPSHGTGKRLKVLPMSRAAIAAGSDGLLIEVHDHPEAALSDGPQALLPEMFAQLMSEVRLLAPVVGRTA
ncbi:MAG: 3-deoxy-7-phosphoheptulonate synthase [Acidobacteria bacterium]|nr:MAG: 3-deoxy-7-phosphoheptulonate synthase [Acidobacteriota bacterium]PYQ65079.1 MAG: 3-deoxy-7-phosphoheptulonate synthase [Acidobacteriota bacterium]